MRRHQVSKLKKSSLTGRGWPRGSASKDCVRTGPLKKAGLQCEYLGSRPLWGRPLERAQARIWRWYRRSIFTEGGAKEHGTAREPWLVDRCAHHGKLDSHSGRAASRCSIGGEFVANLKPEVSKQRFVSTHGQHGLVVRKDPPKQLLNGKASVLEHQCFVETCFKSPSLDSSHPRPNPQLQPNCVLDLVQEKAQRSWFQPYQVVDGVFKTHLVHNAPNACRAGAVMLSTCPDAAGSGIGRAHTHTHRALSTCTLYVATE